MRSIILINLQSAWNLSGTTKPLHKCIVEFQESYTGIFQIDDLLPSLAGNLFSQWIKDNVPVDAIVSPLSNLIIDNNNTYQPIKEVIESVKTMPVDQSRNIWSPKTLSTEHTIAQQFVCQRCNRPFSSQLALNGHGKSSKCKKED
jgi:hypothetical protein